MHWGADAIFTLDKGKLTLASYYKMPAPQTENENCVAHNGSLVPIPARSYAITLTRSATAAITAA